MAAPVRVTAQVGIRPAPSLLNCEGRPSENNARSDRAFGGILKKTVALALLTLALSIPAFAHSRDTQAPRSTPAQAILKLIKRLVPFSYLPTIPKP